MTLDLATVRAYVQVPATLLSDADLTRMMGAADAYIAARATVPDPAPEGVEQAFLRLVQREIAAKNLPLGMVGLDNEYGPASLAAYDALVEQHLRPYRTQVLA